MIMLIALLVIMGLVALIVSIFRDNGKCPVCYGETVEVGYEGYRRKCLNCGWNNTDSEVLSDDFLDEDTK